MKRDDTGPSWEAWRSAEASGTPDEGDRAFAALARGWTREPVPAGLAARIAAAAGGAPAASLWASAWLRAAGAAAVLVTGAVLGGMSGASLRGLALASFQAVAGGIGAVQRLTAAWAALGDAFVRPASSVGRALAGALAEPMPLFIVALNFGIAAAALAVLRRVLAVREV
jgi:hypothetical protein